MRLVALKPPIAAAYFLSSANGIDNDCPSLWIVGRKSRTGDRREIAFKDYY
jgi:hypothetical protein